MWPLQASEDTLDPGLEGGVGQTRKFHYLQIAVFVAFPGTEFPQILRVHHTSLLVISTHISVGSSSPKQQGTCTS